MDCLTVTESIFCLFNLLEDILVLKSPSRLRQSLINITTIFLRSVNKVYVVHSITNLGQSCENVCNVETRNYYAILISEVNHNRTHSFFKKAIFFYGAQ